MKYQNTGKTTEKQGGEEEGEKSQKLLVIRGLSKNACVT